MKPSLLLDAILNRELHDEVKQLWECGKLRILRPPKKMNVQHPSKNT